MAIIRSDGMDIYSNIAAFLATGWYRESVTQNGLSTTLGRFGGGCLQGSLTSGSNGWYTSVSFAADAAMHMAFAYRHDGATTTDTLFEMLGYTLAQTAGRVTVSATGTLQAINRAGTVVETTSGTPLTPGTWHWVEIKFISGSGATNGAIVVRVDGVQVLNQTAIDTRPNGVSQTVGVVKLSGPRAGTADVRIDDIFIMDTTGSAFNNFMDDRRIQTLLPTADSATVNWTASAGNNIDCVDDALGAANDDTDYISSVTAGQESRFVMASLPVSPLSVDAVTVRFKAKKTDAGARTMRGLVNSNSMEAVGTTVALQTEYVWKSGGPMLTNPDGGGSWTESTVNALQAGVEVVA